MIGGAIEITGGGTFILISMFSLLRGRLKRANGAMVIANGCYLIGNVLDHARGPAMVSAGACVISAWCWWNSGGGDGTKRRLKSWARKFQGTRRTAPSYQRA